METRSKSVLSWEWGSFPTMGKTSGLVKGTKSVINIGDISDVTWNGDGSYGRLL